MARGRKTDLRALEEKIEKQKDVLKKARDRYETEKETLAGLMKLRSELQTEALVTAISKSTKSYEEIMKFITSEE